MRLLFLDYFHSCKPLFGSNVSNQNFIICLFIFSPVLRLIGSAVYLGAYGTYCVTSKESNDENKVNIRVRPRFFDQVGHQTTNASSGNKHFLLNNVIIRLTNIMNKADKN